MRGQPHYQGCVMSSTNSPPVCDAQVDADVMQLSVAQLQVTCAQYVLPLTLIEDDHDVAVVKRHVEESVLQAQEP